MSAKLLPFSAGIPLAAAFVIGYHNTKAFDTPGASNTFFRQESQGRLQPSSESQAATQVPKRSLKSRQTDPSLATRFRSSGNVTVGGQVRNPGPVRYSAGMTLWSSIQEAGGVTEFGSIRRVTLYRDGKREVYDMTRNLEKLPILKVNDIIEVPQETFWGS